MMKACRTDSDDLGKSGLFEELEQLLRDTGYSEDYLCRRFGLKNPEDFELDSSKRGPLPPLESAADVLLKLFLYGESIGIDPVLEHLSPQRISLLEGMGLIRTDPDSGSYYANSALYPVENFYVASDRWNNPDGSSVQAWEDTVYPAFVPNTRLFLRHLPTRPGGAFLDLCGGTGIAALLAAKGGAAQAWSGDIAERSTRFAEFNCKLNRAGNVHPVTSDLYAAFKDSRFDIITAHPPYVPTLQPKWIFFSGGRDGEEITRRIISGLPDHLNNEGAFVAVTMGADRVGQPFEHRVRGWLGECAGEFDIALIVRTELDPQEFALRANRESVRTREESDAWKRFFKGLGITSLVYGVLVIQRRASATRNFTVRRQATPGSLRSPWEWLMQWESEAAADSVTELILGSPLNAAQGIEFQVLHRLERGEWNPASYTLRTAYPFNMECSAQPWMAHIISLSNGVATGRDILAVLKQNTALPRNTPEREFARAVASLISGGFLEIAGFRIPRAAE
jgi:SAM-dependent methyltransferase